MGKGSSVRLRFEGEDKGGRRAIEAEVSEYVVAGWTARDVAAMEAHIRELEHLGIARPKRTPIFYRCAASLLTTAEEIQVAGRDTSGEVEPVLVSLADGLWVTVGSDHTDRKVEAVGITIAKQLCAKPMAPLLWRFEEVEPHWDRLQLASWAVTDGARRIYQHGRIDAIRHPRELMRMYLGRDAVLPAGQVMTCGTLPAEGGIKPAARFEMELLDPVLGRSIRHAYDVLTLPVEG